MANSVFINPDTDAGSPSTSIIPTADNTYDLGSASFQWKSLYLGTSLVMGASGRIFAADGSFAAPSQSYINDTDTGRYWGSSGIEVFSSNGTARISFGASVTLGSTGSIAWTNGGVVSGTTDTGIERVTAGAPGVQRTALGTTSSDGFVLFNGTAATGAATVQISPRLRLRGNAWNTSASETVDFFLENLPATAATPTGTLKFGYSLNGAAASYPMTLTSAGLLNAASYSVGGAAGASGTGTVISSITVTNGIVTAITVA